MSALTPHSLRFLQEIDAWKWIEASGRYCPFTSMQVWQGSDQHFDMTESVRGGIHFDARETDQDFIGAIVENCVIEDALLRALEEGERGIQGHPESESPRSSCQLSEGIRFTRFPRATMEGLNRKDQHMHLKINGATVETQLVVILGFKLSSRHHVFTFAFVYRLGLTVRIQPFADPSISKLWT